MTSIYNDEVVHTDVTFGEGATSGFSLETL